MSKLVVKTGMTSEYKLASKYAAPGTMVLTGLQTVDDLDRIVPRDCEAIISFGLCGGLAPQAQIGQIFIANLLITPSEYYMPDVAWRMRLFHQTNAYERHWYSSGDFNTANTIDQRSYLFTKSGCWVIDDETYAVAEFAKRRGIAWQAIRSVSDGAEDNLPPAVTDALNADGSDNLWRVIESVVSDPKQIPALVKTAEEYIKSLAELRTCALQIGPSFQWS